MAVNTLSADSTVQWTANAAGDTYVVEEDVHLNVLGTAISASAAVTNRKFIIQGHVIGESGGTGLFAGQDASNGGNSTILIAASGSILGEAYGVVAHGGGLHFSNAGSVTGATAGLYMTGADNGVDNTGDIVSYDGMGINSQGTGALIENSGTISGETCGVQLAGAASILVNTGSISASDGDFGSNAVRMTGGNTEFHNEGTVSGQGGRVIMGSSGSEGITNTGMIIGYVDLGDGSDTFVNNGGSVFGIINLGQGQDNFFSKGGLYIGSVTGGADDDEYFVYDTQTDILEDENGGADTVHAFVSYSLGDNFEYLDLKGGADLTGRGNALDNVITGNDGDNRLYGRAGADIFIASDGRDLHDGGAGVDQVDYSYSDFRAVTINLQTGKGGGAAAGHRYVGIEQAVGTEFKDHLIGSAAANRLEGGLANDMMIGLGGKDVFVYIDFDDIDTITDFEHLTDRIELGYHANGVDIVDFGDVKDRMTQKGTDTVIDFGDINAGDKLILRDVDLNDLSAADFKFV
jgi:hypothetical protein